MSEKRQNCIEYCNEILTQQINHWMLFPLIVTVIGCTNSYLATPVMPNLLIWFCCGLLPLLTFLIRRFTPHFLPFVLGNLLVFGLSFLIPAENMVVRVLCVVSGGGYLIHTFILRLKVSTIYTGMLSPAVGAAGAAVGMFLLKQLGVTGLENYYIYTLLICLAAYMLTFYIRHYMSFLEYNKSSSSSIPAAEMFQSGMGLVLIFTLMGSLLVLFATNITWFESLWKLIKLGLLTVLRFLFRLFYRESSREETVPEMPDASGGENGGLDGLPAGEAGLFWIIMEYVCVALLICAVVYVTIRALVAIVRFIRNQFALSFEKHATNNIDGTIHDVREKCEPISLHSDSTQKRGFFGFLSPQERIRKLYKKRLLASSVMLVKGEQEKLGLFTARESELKLELKGMAEIYEKARYSNSAVSSDDVKHMKEACR